MFESEAHTEWGSPSLVGRGIANPQEELQSQQSQQPPPGMRFTLKHNINNNFKDYLKAQNKRNIKQIMCYAQRYASAVLETGDAIVLTTLSSAKRRHIMEALSAWSKYTGTYPRWQNIYKSHSLRWTSDDTSLIAMQRFFNPELNLDSMLQRIRRMIEILPPLMGRIVHWGTLVGLRANEIIESVRFINDKEAFSKYYDPIQMTLNHWKMPGMIRKTKKAYLSFMSPQMLEQVQNLDIVPTYSSIRHACNRRGIACSLHLCRKVFASWLHESGIPDITIDMLQGRCPKSVLAQHYIVPNASLKDTVLEALAKLKQQIDQ